jgi:hypothetical protein
VLKNTAPHFKIPPNSGHSPIADTLPQNLTENQRQFREAYIQHQKDNFAGFTAMDLVNLDAIDDRGLKEGNLGEDVPIHPLLAQNRWVAYGNKATNMGHFQDADPTFDPANDALWEKLKPALLITTRLMRNLHTLPFVRRILVEWRELTVECSSQA